MFKNLGIVLSTFCFLLPILIVAFLFKESYFALYHFGLYKFLFDPSWYPNEGMVGLAPQIQGSLAVSILALVLALPSSLSFVYLNEFYVPKKLSSFFNLCVDTLSGIPSVIFGLWGLIKIIPLLSEKYPPGTCLGVGALILAMMIFPGFVVGLRGLLHTFNQHYKMSAMSISLSPGHYFFSVFLRSSVKGFISVTLLQFGRALGETMAVLMVTGNVSQSPDSIFSPIRNLTSNIALEMAYAEGAHRSSLYMSGLILALVLLACLLIAFLIRGEHD